MTGTRTISQQDACVLLETGRSHGRLTVKGLNRNGDVVCDCDCGATVAIDRKVFLAGRRFQCGGCDNFAAASLTQKIIGCQDTYEVLMSRAAGAKDRCQNPNNPNWENYGGRGIEFRFEDLEQFALYLWILGWRYGDPRTTDRIDVDGHYDPLNVRLALPVEQVRNRRVSVVVDTGDDVVSLADLAEHHGISPRSSEYVRLSKFVSKTKREVYDQVMDKISELSDDNELDEEFA